MKEMYQLLIRYTKDIDSTDITVAELQRLPYWRCVWGNWKAKAHYQMDYYYERLEDVLEGLDSYSIMGEVFTTYWTECGELRSQAMDKDTCKSVYGQ